MKIKLKMELLALAVAVMLPSHNALADTIELNGWWGGNGVANVTLKAGGENYNNGSVLGSNYTVSGGAGGFKSYDLTTDPGRTNSFQSWCVDIFHHFGFPVTAPATKTSAATFFGSTLGAADGARIAADLGRLATNHLADVIAPISNATTNLNSVAFQLVVWEIVNENAGFYGLGSGQFVANSATGTAISLANTWLAQLAGTTSQYTVDIWGVSNGASGTGMQDVAVFAPVPEPEIYVMLAAGFGLMGFVARRRRQTAA